MASISSLRPVVAPRAAMPVRAAAPVVAKAEPAKPVEQKQPAATKEPSLLASAAFGSFLGAGLGLLGAITYGSGAILLGAIGGLVVGLLAPGIQRNGGLPVTPEAIAYLHWFYNSK